MNCDDILPFENPVIFAIGGQNKEEFVKEAQQFIMFHGISPDALLVQADPPKTLAQKIQSARLVEAHIESRAQNSDVDFVAIFCHGWMRGLQCGWNTTNVSRIVKRISKHLSPDVVFVTYACSAADGRSSGLPKEYNIGPASDGGFCDELRDALCAESLPYCRVFGHTTAGHTTRNPHVVIFRGTGSHEPGIGGEWIIRPRSSLWAKWRKALSGNMRFVFPFLEPPEIEDILRSQLGK